MEWCWSQQKSGCSRTESSRGGRHSCPPQKRSVVCSWYKALLTPWIATNSRFMSDWDTGDQCLLPAEVPAVSWQPYLQLWVQSPVGPSSLPVQQLHLRGGQMTLALGDFPQYEGCLSSCWFRSPEAFTEAKYNQPALFFSSEKPHVRQACLLPSTREIISNCGGLVVCLPCPKSCLQNCISSQ